MSEAILLKTTIADGPIPPEVEKIKGANEPCSTSLILNHKLCASLVPSGDRGW
jgi:hypothetical protein